MLASLLIELVYGLCDHLKREKKGHFNLLQLLHLNSNSKIWNENLHECIC